MIEANNLPFRKLLNLSKKVPNSKSIVIPTHFVATAGLMLFCLLLYYVYQEDIWKGELKLFFFSIVFLGTIANGAFSDGKKWGVLLWVGIFLLLSPLFLISQDVSEPILLLLLGAFGGHSAWLLFFFFKVLRNGRNNLGK